MAKTILVIGCVGLCLVVAGCSDTQPVSPTPSPLTLATTTSTQDSGLLDVLLPLFKEQTGMEVKVVAVGSGQALELGRRGDADVLLTHSPAAEEVFMDEGFGAQRHAVMHNDFVLVGPADDPAGIRGEKSIVAAFSRIAKRGNAFVSRGDDSGTHQKEKAIWKQADANPEGDWYVRAGSGMAHVLRMAHEKRAYTLADRGTYLALRNELDLVVLSEGDSLLLNRYSVIAVSGQKHPHLNTPGASRFVQFLLHAETKKGSSD